MVLGMWLLAVPALGGCHLLMRVASLEEMSLPVAGAVGAALYLAIAVGVTRRYLES
jgi:hypothetical protein